MGESAIKRVIPYAKRGVWRRKEGPVLDRSFAKAATDQALAGKARRANARELVGARRSLPSSPGPLIYGMQSFFLKWGGGKRMEKKEKGGK